MKISSALKYQTEDEEKSLQVVSEASPGHLGHCREERNRGGRIERGRERRISGRWSLRQTNKQLNRLTGDGGTDESYRLKE